MKNRDGKISNFLINLLYFRSLQYLGNFSFGKGAKSTLLTYFFLFQDIFTQIDENGDGTLTEEEFLTGCLEDETLFKMLVPNVFQ